MENAKTLAGETAENAVKAIFANGSSVKLPPIIKSEAEFSKAFASPVRTAIGEIVHIGKDVYNKIIRNVRENVSGALRPTLEDADFVIIDTDGSRLYVKLFEKEDGSKHYNVTVVNKKGEVDDYVSSVHIKSDNNLLNKIKAGAQLLLPSKRNTYEEKSPSSQVPTSAGKDSESSDTKQENAEENARPERAIERIPSEQVTGKDGKTMTVHHWEEAAPEDTYDALNGMYGDAELTGRKVGKRIENIDKKLESLQKQRKKIDDSDDFDADFNNAEAYSRMNEQRKQLEAQKAYWQSVAAVPAARAKAEADCKAAEAEARRKAEAEAKAKAEAAAKAKAEEEARHAAEMEAFSHVPEWGEDTPEAARMRGYRRQSDEKIERQKPLAVPTGKAVSVRFSTKDVVKGKVAVVDARQLQASHVNGQRNRRYFLDEAQPKDRTDQASVVASRRIAQAIRPEEITGTATAYTGAPVVNSRGEVIQGNNRKNALELMYGEQQYAESAAKYKQYLIDHAAEYGIDPKLVEGTERPVLAIIADVSDAEAIRLGQMTAADTESGGKERIRASQTRRKMTDRQMRTFLNLLLNDNGDDTMSVSEMIASNGVEALKYLHTVNAISDTQLQSAYDGKLTDEAKTDIRDLLYDTVFQGGGTELRKQFNALPVSAQRAILATAWRDIESADGDRMLGEIQRSIYACVDMRASFGEELKKCRTKEDVRKVVWAWKRQSVFNTATGKAEYVTDKYSNFAIELATRYLSDTQKEVQGMFNELYDEVQGKGEDMFDPESAMPKSLAAAIRRVLDIDYKPIRQENNGNGQNERASVGENDTEGEEGRQGSPGDAGSGERGTEGEQLSERGGRAESDGGVRQQEDNSIFQYFTGPLADMIARAKQSATGFMKKVLAPVSPKLRKDLEARGVTLDGNYNHVIDNSAIRHTFNEHGDERERKRGQIPITDADFDLIPEIVSEYDDIKVEKGKRNALNIIYSKTYDDGTTIFIEEKRDKHNELAAVTMWKQKSSTRTDANRRNTTPISDLSETSKSKDNEAVVNEQENAGENLQQAIGTTTGEAAKQAERGKVNTENNKKSLDAVTYDDEGNVIPLSKRFNEQERDVRFRDGETEDKDKIVTTDGIVLPATVKVVKGEEKHGFKSFADARQWAREHIVRTLGDAETNGKGNIRISGNAINKFLSNSSVSKSESNDVHLSVLKVLPDVIRESVDAEQHPDYKKNEKGVRSTDAGYNPDIVIHRLYSAVSIGGQVYRVKVTLKEYADNNEPNKAYSYEATKIELLAGTLVDGKTTDPSTNNSISTANLLKDVEKSYGNGQKLLSESEKLISRKESIALYVKKSKTL